MFAWYLGGSRIYVVVRREVATLQRGHFWTMVQLNVFSSPPLWPSVRLCLWGLLFCASAPPCKLSVSTDSRLLARTVDISGKFYRASFKLYPPFQSPKLARPLIRALAGATCEWFVTGLSFSWYRWLCCQWLGGLRQRGGTGLARWCEATVHLSSRVPPSATRI